jgi:hypothetical protein
MNFSSLPRFPSADGPDEPVTAAGDPPPPAPVLEVTCPVCGGRTNHIQAYEIPVVVFLLVYVIWGRATVAGCPRCVRASLWRQFWVSVPAANVLFPIVGPLIFRQISASDEAIVPTIPPEYHGWADAPSGPVSDWTGTRGRRGFRLVIALALVACMAAIMFVVLPAALR